MRSKSSSIIPMDPFFLVYIRLFAKQNEIWTGKDLFKQMNTMHLFSYVLSKGVHIKTRNRLKV